MSSDIGGVADRETISSLSSSFGPQGKFDLKNVWSNEVCLNNVYQNNICLNDVCFNDVSFNDVCLNDVISSGVYSNDVSFK